MRIGFKHRNNQKTNFKNQTFRLVYSLAEQLTIDQSKRWPTKKVRSSHFHSFRVKVQLESITIPSPAESNSNSESFMMEDMVMDPPFYNTITATPLVPLHPLGAQRLHHASQRLPKEKDVLETSFLFNTPSSLLLHSQWVNSELSSYPVAKDYDFNDVEQVHLGAIEEV